MSKFDPFDIYIPKTRYTTDGQIIRKRLRSESVKPCYSQDNINEAKKIVESQYQVIPKGINLYTNQLAFYDDTRTLDIGGIEWQTLSPIPISFSSVYSDLKTDMSSFFQIVSGKTIESFYFECDLLSIKLLGDFTTNIEAIWQIRNVMKDNRNFLVGVIDTLDRIPTQVYIDSSFINKELYSMVYSNDYDWGRGDLAQKNFNTNIDFLDNNVTEDPVFLNNLINEDFTQNDFNIVNLLAAATSSADFPVSVANLFLTIRIKMYAIYK